MRIGVPTEIKSNEFRVGLVPGSVRELTARGHDVVVQSGAGAGIFADDAAYAKAGARILPTAEAVFAEAEMIVKVKEPQAVEYRRLKPHQILFTYLHLAPDPEQARGLMASGATAIAYETVTDAAGGLPLLAPMSEVAGRLAIEAAAIALSSWSVPSLTPVIVSFRMEASRTTPVAVSKAASTTAAAFAVPSVLSIPTSSMAMLPFGATFAASASQMHIGRSMKAAARKNERTRRAIYIPSGIP